MRLVRRRREIAVPVLAADPREAMLALLLKAADSGPDGSSFEILDTLRRFQSDTATLLEAQIDRIEALNREIASLRDEVRGRRGPIAEPAEPLRLDLIPTPSPAGSDESASWLLDRLNTLEAEGRSTWKDILGRIASTVAPRSTPDPGTSLAPTRPETPRERPFLKSPRIDSERPAHSEDVGSPSLEPRTSLLRNARDLPGPSYLDDPDSPAPGRPQSPPGPPSCPGRKFANVLMVGAVCLLTTFGTYLRPASALPRTSNRPRKLVRRPSSTDVPDILSPSVRLHEAPGRPAEAGPRLPMYRTYLGLAGSRPGMPRKVCPSR